MNSDAPSPSRSRHSLTAVLAALYAHEINCGLSSFWDGGWSVWIGDDMNGHRAFADFDRDSLELLPQWLAEAASELFPNAALPWERREPKIYRPEHARSTPSRAFLTLVASPINGDGGNR